MTANELARQIRAMGYAVVIFSPEELDEMNATASQIEDAAVSFINELMLGPES